MTSVAIRPLRSGARGARPDTPSSGRGPAPLRLRLTRSASAGTGTRRRWRWVVGAVVAFAVLLGAVALQVMLIGGQRRLDQVRLEIEQARIEQNALRRDESQLRSPSDIRDLAIERLGMVSADLPALVPSAPVTIGYPAGDPRGAATPVTGLQPVELAAPAADADSAPDAVPDPAEATP